jgi:hypothetical protein
VPSENQKQLWKDGRERRRVVSEGKGSIRSLKEMTRDAVNASHLRQWCPDNSTSFNIVPYLGLIVVIQLGIDLLLFVIS